MDDQDLNQSCDSLASLAGDCTARGHGRGANGQPCPTTAAIHTEHVAHLRLPHALPLLSQLPWQSRP